MIVLGSMGSVASLFFGRIVVRINVRSAMLNLCNQRLQKTQSSLQLIALHSSPVRSIPCKVLSHFKFTRPRLTGNTMSLVTQVYVRAQVLFINFSALSQPVLDRCKQYVRTEQVLRNGVLHLGRSKRNNESLKVVLCQRTRERENAALTFRVKIIHQV